MKTTLKWLAICLPIYLIFLVVKLPAAQVLPRLPIPKDIGIAGISGTLWNGQIQQLVINGLPISQVDWQLNPWALLMGKIELETKGGNARDKDDIAFKGQLIVGFSGIEGQQLQVFLPTPLLIAQLPLPLPVEAGGRFRVEVAHVLVEQEQCSLLQGQGQWLQASVSGTQGPIELGAFDAKLSCEKGNVLVDIAEPNSFGLNAQASVSPDMDIKVNGKFKPDPTLPEEVQVAAQLFGKPDNQGYYKLKF